MAEARHRARLADEALREGRILAQLGRQDLHRHVAVELLVDGPVDRAHPAAPDHLQDLEPGQEGVQGLRGRGLESAGG
jgi:hypothetical protein